MPYPTKAIVLIMWVIPAKCPKWIRHCPATLVAAAQGVIRHSANAPSRPSGDGQRIRSVGRNSERTLSGLFATFVVAIRNGSSTSIPARLCEIDASFVEAQTRLGLRQGGSGTARLAYPYAKDTNTTLGALRPASPRTRRQVGWLGSAPSLRGA